MRLHMCNGVPLRLKCISQSGQSEVWASLEFKSNYEKGLAITVLYLVKINIYCQKPKPKINWWLVPT